MVSVGPTGSSSPVHAADSALSSPAAASHSAFSRARTSAAISFSKVSVCLVTLSSSHLVVLNDAKKPLEKSHQQRSATGMVEGNLSWGRSGSMERSASWKVVTFSDHGRTRGVSMGTGGQ